MRIERMYKQLGALAALAVLGIVFVTYGWVWTRPEPMYEGRPVREWVRDALDWDNSGGTNNDRYVVSTRLRSEVAPYLIRELKRWSYPRWYYRLYGWHLRLPQKLWLIPEPKDPRGALSGASWIVSEMGEAGAPVYGQLARSMTEANTHLWEFLEVLRDLIQAGPVAKGALPTLRKMAADKGSGFRVQAALAIYNTEGSTNALAETLSWQLAKPGGFSAVDYEIWWFRSDETVQDILLPLLCPIARDETQTVRDRITIVCYLGDLLSTNELARLTLQELRDSATNAELADEVREALETLSNPVRQAERWREYAAKNEEKD